ncbi:hypothetical protein [Comamonas sp.]|uniref:hypothetical protein n=1 Tax=Comamonas sp. TaxID=34028 RepID=UPI0028A6BFA7|nr:hypothetical protein [Comamonas sp.]
MDADFDLGPDGEVRESGFRRAMYKNPGGRPRGYSPKIAREIKERLTAGESDEDEVDPESQEGQITTAVKTAVAKARKETARAGLNELELKIKTREYLPRAAYREATATLLATLSQGMRSLTDTLESKCGLPPAALEVVDEVINESLKNIAETLALFAGDEA